MSEALKGLQQAAEDYESTCTNVARAALTAGEQEPVAWHPDDEAVDRFAAAMKAKLAKKRSEGRGGWETCAPEYLSELLRDHVEKGDPVDVGNLAMMIHQIGGRIHG